MLKKILISFFITLVLLVTLGVTSIIKMAELANLSQKLYDHPFTVTNATKTIEMHLVSMHRYMKDVALSNNDQELQSAVDQVNKSEIIVYKQFDVIFDRYLGNKEDIQKSYDAFVNWKPIRDEVISLMKQNKKFEAAQITKHKGAKHVEHLNLQVDKLIDYAQNKAIFFNENAIKSKNDAIKLIIILIVVITLISAFVLFLLITNISKTDKEIKKHFHMMDQNIMSATLECDFSIRDISSDFARYLGYTKEEMLAQSGNFIYHDCDKAQKEAIIRMVQSGANWNGEIKKFDIHNDIKWLHSSIQPVFDENYKITGYANIFHDISSKKQIEEISNIDALTNLYNRRFFDNIFPNKIKISKRNNALLVFAIMDIDFFKQYNDTYGHQAGDLTLKKVSAVLKKSLKRPNDYSFRLGGEEFGMLFDISEEKDARTILEKVRQNVEDLKIEHEKNKISTYVTLSIGVSFIYPDKDYDVEDIYKSADELLYKAKQTGRNKVVMDES